MKQLIKQAFALSAIAFSMVSCQVDDSFAPADNTLVSSVSFQSEINTRATDTSFESGDQISVTAYSSDDTRYQSNIAYTYYDAVFTSTSPIKYEDSDQYLSFRAIYPYTEADETGVFTFEVKADQNEGTNYTLSDLMSSYASSTQSTTPTLKFNHLLSRVIINVTSTDISLDEAVTTVNALRSVDYNLVTSTSIATGSTESIIMTTNGTNSFKAILPPQNIDKDVVFGSIVVGGSSYDISFDFGKILNAGLQYEFDLEIKDGYIKFISSSINDWEDGDSSSQGEATFTLSDVSSTAYPTGVKKWIVTDTEATYDDMSGLRDAIYNYRYSTEKIMLEFPNLTSLPEKGLYNSDGIESVTLSAATSIGANAFYDCDYLTLIEAPLVDVVDTYAFRYCSALTSIDLSGANSIGSYAFQSCTSLATLSLPSATTIDSYAFSGCTSLTIISLPAVTSVGTYAFNGCTALTSLTLATESILEIFGDGSGDCFTDVEISKIDLTVGSTVDVCDNTMFAPVSSGGVVYYGSFASITGGNSVEDVAPTSILEYSATNYPIYSNDWVINDTEAPLAYFVGLNEALTMAAANGRQINLSFPNLDRFPSTAFYIDKAASITNIATVNAPNVTEVGEYAFYGSSSITSISMDKLESVGDYAFRYCSSLTTVSLPEATSVGDDAFYYCSSLQSVYLPKVLEIKSGINSNYGTFYRCSELTEISLSSAISIGSYAFNHCSSLTTISLPTATYIGSSAFSTCTSLTTVSLPVATSIGSSAFNSCSSLTTVSLPKVTSIAPWAFESCASLDSISFPDATSIDYAAFNGCMSLATISLPEATSIESYAFSSCSSLTTISLPEATDIGSYAFSSCTSLTTISLPVATDIGVYAFQFCTSLTTISLPEATSIGSYAFRYCSSLTTISLPEATSIGYEVFYSCSSLTTVSLPKVTSLGGNSSSYYGVFMNCTRLQSVSVPALSVIYGGTFSSCYMLLDLEIASNDGVALTHFGTYGSDLFEGIDISYMTLTTGSTNASMVSGNYIAAPAYESSSSYPDQTYGPFKEIVVK